MAQIHRFRECVAVSLGTGETVYLTPVEAKKIAKAMRACALEIDKKSFADSTVGTVNVDINHKKWING